MVVGLLGNLEFAVAPIERLACEGRFLSAEATTQFDMGNKFFEPLTGFVIGIGAVVMPAATRLKSAGKVHELVLEEGYVSGKLEEANKVTAAKQVGQLIAASCKEKGITKVVFDRNGYLYHGRVAALADAAREAGLGF